MFKMFKAILRTAGKTPEDIKQMYDGSVGPEPSEEEIQGYIDVYNKLDGLEVVVYDRGQLGVADYGLYVWQKRMTKELGNYFTKQNKILTLALMLMSVMNLLKIGKLKNMNLVLLLHLELMM